MNILDWYFIIYKSALVGVWNSKNLISLFSYGQDAMWFSWGILRKYATVWIYTTLFGT